MKTKLNYVFTISAIIILVISSLAIANADKEFKIFKPSEKFRDWGEIKDIFASKNVYKRIIADDVDEEGIKSFENKGCLIRHKLKRSASFNCPENVASELKTREARVFHILDLEADQQIKANQVWAEGINGAGVNVVILDTGIDSSHFELSDSIVGQKDFVSNDDVAEDPSGHGTHVAGIVTADGEYTFPEGYNAKGVAPGAGVYMLRVCDTSGLCFEDDMMAAMDYAVNNITDAKIMSISIGGGNFGSHCDSDPLAAKVNWVVDNGYTVVIAAGNDGKGVSTPACASKAIAVGAVDKTGVVPWWSNRGSALDILAPGVDIFSTYSCLAAGNCASNWYAWMTGTSMSTPHVSGVAALLLQTKPTAATDEIKNALYSTADPAAKCYKCTILWRGRCYQQSEVTCTSDITGAGIVDAYGAYLAVKPTGPPLDTDGDGVPDSTDNCPTISNPSQSDIDSDGIGDACDSCTDVDKDTYCAEVNDCNDSAATVHPGALDAVCNGIDDDCDGLVDEGYVVTTTSCGVGACSASGQLACLNGTEINSCTPGNPSAEICDGVDNNCNAVTDEGNVCGLPTEVIEFSDSFEVSEWNSLWVEDAQNDWFRSSQRARDGVRSAEVDGSAKNATITMANTINLAGKIGATLNFSWFIESNWDSNEYICLDIFSNGVWNNGVPKTERCLDGNFDTENVWHDVSLSLSSYLTSDFKIRFRAKVSDSSEDGNVDKVVIRSYY